MNKANLKNNWGKYCDTDKLVDDMMEMFRRYNVRRSEHGVCTMLNTYFTNKHELIDLLQNSPNYAGDMRVIIDAEMERYADRRTIGNFVSSFYGNVEVEKHLLKTETSDGKKLSDYIKIGKRTVTVSDIVEDKIKTADFGRWSEVFDRDGKTKESTTHVAKFSSAINRFYYYNTATVNGMLSSQLKENNANLKIAEGTKTSRAFNKVCHEYGVDKLPKYNKLFAEYSDMINTGKRTLKFFISVNPLDYITMSVGRSWTSCHYPNHGYFAGTASYMMDATSIITFIHDMNVEDIVYDGKLYRNMFFFKDNTLLQSRIYPQGNDGCTDLYAEFRGIVQKEIAEMLGMESNWNSCGMPSITSYGMHYRDYSYNRNAYTTYIGRIPVNSMTIGHTNICAYCGREDNIDSNRIAHHHCEF